jgi:hypothetical protein
MYLPLQDRPKFTHFGIFVLKIYHLATLFQSLAGSSRILVAVVT